MMGIVKFCKILKYRRIRFLHRKAEVRKIITVGSLVTNLNLKRYELKQIFFNFPSEYRENGTNLAKPCSAAIIIA